MRILDISLKINTVYERLKTSEDGSKIGCDVFVHSIDFPRLFFLYKADDSCATPEIEPYTVPASLLDYVFKKTKMEMLSHKICTEVKYQGKARSLLLEDFYYSQNSL
jgi:hypothetical protein